MRYGRIYKWVYFLIRPDIAGINTDYVWYASPNASAEEYIDQEILEHEGVYLSHEVYTRLLYLEIVVDATEPCSRIWTEISTQ